MRENLFANFNIATHAENSHDYYSFMEKQILVKNGCAVRGCRPIICSIMIAILLQNISKSNQIKGSKNLKVDKNNYLNNYLIICKTYLLVMQFGSLLSQATTLHRRLTEIHVNKAEDPILYPSTKNSQNYVHLFIYRLLPVNS